MAVVVLVVIAVAAAAAAAAVAIEVAKVFTQHFLKVLCVVKIQYNTS